MASSGRRVVLGSIDRLFRTGTASGLSDGQLLERFATRHDEGAEAAFATLVERHGPMVLRVCRRVLNDPHDAQDAFQATFLVLMKKAGAVRRRESLSSWLYGVARRVSSHARASAARRRTVEKGAVRPETAEAAPDPADRELWDEVDRLPDSHRTAVVLCYLEGLTHEQAAARLGWPVGTVRSRLARARDRLRGRLERRGHAPSGFDPTSGLVAALRLTGRESLSPKLIESTARAALTLAARDAAEAGLVSAKVVTLTEGVLRAMLITKLKTTAAAFVTAGTLVAGAGVYAEQPPDESLPVVALSDDTLPPGTATPRAKKANTAARVDPSAVLQKLVAQARAEQNEGDIEAARRTLNEVRDVVAHWEAVLGGRTPARAGGSRPRGGADAAPVALPPRPPEPPQPPGPGDEPVLAPVAPLAPIAAVPPGVIADVAPLPPAPPGGRLGPYSRRPAAAPAMPRFAPPESSRRNGPPQGADETETRLNEIERKLDAILRSLKTDPTPRPELADEPVLPPPARSSRPRSARTPRAEEPSAAPALPRPPQPPTPLPAGTSADTAPSAETPRTPDVLGP